MAPLQQITVSGLDWIARGQQRLVVIHPHDPGKILKIAHAGPGHAGPAHDGTGPDGMPVRTLSRAAIAPTWRNRHVLRERKVYRALGPAIAADPVAAPIPRFFGTIGTDLGDADVYEGIFRRDGSALGLTLRQLIRRALLGPHTLADLNAFVGRLEDWDIPVTDLNADNVVYGVRAGRPVFVLVDGFGDYRRIPLAWWLRPVRRRRIALACRDIADQAGLSWDDAARRFRP